MPRRELSPRAPSTSPSQRKRTAKGPIMPNSSPKEPDEDGGQAEGFLKLRWDVSVGTLAVFGAQLVAAAIYVNSLENRVQNLEKEDVTIKKQIEEKSADAGRSMQSLMSERDGSRDRLTRLETTLQYQVDLLRRIEAKVDQISGRRSSLDTPSTAN